MAVVKWRVLWLLLLLHWVGLLWASGPPKVRGRPHHRHVAKKGKNTKLVCPVEADPTPFTEWKKDGETIHNGWTRFKVTQDGQLRIRSVHMMDAGMYVCRATNGFGSISINYTVIVHDEEMGLVQQNGSTFTKSPLEDLTKDGMSPEFKDPEKMQREPVVKPVGSTVRLKCRAKGNPEPQVSWFKDAALLEGGGDHGESPGHNRRSRPHWTLKLSHVQESDSGHYTCMVHNRLGHVNHTFIVEVIDQIQSKPELISAHPQNTTVESGGTASFQCRVKSKLKPLFEWLKRVENPEAAMAVNRTIEVKGQKFMVLRTAGDVWAVPDGSYLTKLVIHGAQPRDAGMYICLSANSRGYSLRSAYLNVMPADSGAEGQSSSSSSNLPLIVGIPCAVVLLLLIAVIIYVQKRRKCSSSRTALKRHRLPVPTTERDPSAAAAAGFCNSYHPSPTTTNTMGGGTTGTTATVTSGGGGSSNIHIHSNALHTHLSSNPNHHHHLYSYPTTGPQPPPPLPLSREVLTKTPAPSVDFGSDISSVSHSQSQSHHHYQVPHCGSPPPPQPPQAMPHFFNSHTAYGY